MSGIDGSGAPVSCAPHGREACVECSPPTFSRASTWRPGVRHLVEMLDEDRYRCHDCGQIGVGWPSDDEACRGADSRTPCARPAPGVYSPRRGQP